MFCHRKEFIGEIPKSENEKRNIIEQHLLIYENIKNVSFQTI